MFNAERFPVCCPSARNVKRIDKLPFSKRSFKSCFAGTKWCGSGDLATSFFDLGTEVKLDMCCRTHDLCPSKVRAHSTRYNITNESMYTK